MSADLRRDSMSSVDGDADYQAVLGGLRAQLDDLDTRLVSLLKERADVIGQVIRQKAAHGLGPVDLKREGDMLARIEAQAASVGLDPKVARQVLKAVIAAFTDVEATALHPES